MCLYLTFKFYWTLEILPWVESMDMCEFQFLNSFTYYIRSVFIPIPKKGNAKERSNYRTIALISHTSQVMLKILQPGFSNMWTVNFLTFKLVLEKAEEPEIKFPTSARSWKKQETQTDSKDRRNLTATTAGGAKHGRRDRARHWGREERGKRTKAKDPPACRAGGP